LFKRGSTTAQGFFLPLVPFNAAVAAVSTLVPLSILALGGNVIDVGFAEVAYSLALIPAPLLWGYVCEWRCTCPTPSSS